MSGISSRNLEGVLFARHDCSIPAFAFDEPTLLRLNSGQALEDALFAKAPRAWLEGYSTAMWSVLWDYLASEARIPAPRSPQWWTWGSRGLGEIYFFDRYAAQVLKSRVEKHLVKCRETPPQLGTSFLGYALELETPQEARAAEEAGLRFLCESPLHFSKDVDWLVVGPLS